MTKSPSGIEEKDQEALDFLKSLVNSSPAGTRRDPVGLTLDPNFYGNLEPKHAGGIEHFSKPDEEIFEWIDLVRAVTDGTQPLVFVELGAGFGLWSSRFYAVSQALQRQLHQVVLVEADLKHFAWIRQHMLKNEIPESRYRALNLAVSDHDGYENFYTSMEASARAGVGEWYGQSLAREAHVSQSNIIRRFSVGRKRKKLYKGWTSARVKCETLSNILQPYGRVSLVDFDIQGSELAVIRDSIKYLNEKVEAIHVSTHSAFVEKAIRRTMQAHNWLNRRDFSVGDEIQMNDGHSFRFRDGRQTWTNPRLLADG